MKIVNVEEALALNITDHKLNVEFKEIRIDGEYSATVGNARSIPTFENLLAPFVDLSNGMQKEFCPKIELLRSAHGAEGTIYNITMPFGTIDLAGRETECRISRQGSFNSSSSDRFGMEMKVQICSNGMMGWKMNKENQAITRFSRNWQAISQERLRAMVIGFEGMQSHYVELADSLDSIQITSEGLKTRLDNLYKGESTRTNRIKEQVSDLFVSGKGNKGQTAWDLFNAVTEYENHHKSYRRGNDNGEENRRKGILSIDMDSLAELVA